MKTPKITRPKFPQGYVDHPISEVSWDYVSRRLKESIDYWLCSVYPDGRPHVVPRWGAFLDDKFYYDGSPETRHAQNIMKNRLSRYILKAETTLSSWKGNPFPLPNRTLNLRGDSRTLSAPNILPKVMRPLPHNGMKVACTYSPLVNASPGLSFSRTQQSLFLNNFNERSWQ